MQIAELTEALSAVQAQREQDVATLRRSADEETQQLRGRLAQLTSALSAAHNELGVQAAAAKAAKEADRAARVAQKKAARAARQMPQQPLPQQPPQQAVEGEDSYARQYNKRARVA